MTSSSLNRALEPFRVVIPLLPDDPDPAPTDLLSLRIQVVRDLEASGATDIRVIESGMTDDEVFGRAFYVRGEAVKP